jgi:ribosomal protein L37E
VAKEIQVTLTCPACGKHSLKLGDGDPACAECEWSDRAESVADSYAQSRYPSWKHHQDGPEDEIGTCEACGYNVNPRPAPSGRKAAA